MNARQRSNTEFSEVLASRCLISATQRREQKLARFLVGYVPADEKHHWWAPANNTVAKYTLPKSLYFIACSPPGLTRISPRVAANIVGHLLLGRFGNQCVPSFEVNKFSIKINYV